MSIVSLREEQQHREGFVKEGGQADRHGQEAGGGHVRMRLSDGDSNDVICGSTGNGGGRCYWQRCCCCGGGHPWAVQVGTHLLPHLRPITSATKPNDSMPRMTPLISTF